MSDLITLVEGDGPWSIIADSDKTWIAVAYNGEPVEFMSFNIPEDSDLRYVDIMDSLIQGATVTTNYLTAYVIEIDQDFDDWDGVYLVRAAYVPTGAEDEGVNIATADTVAEALAALQAYTGAESDEEDTDE